jgi:hypothetical protein
MFEFVKKAQSYNSNPADLFKQVTKGYTKEQMEELFTRAKQYGITDDVINKVR